MFLALHAEDNHCEVKVMFEVPREQWGEYAERAVVLPLDLGREVRRFGAGVRGE